MLTFERIEDLLFNIHAKVNMLLTLDARLWERIYTFLQAQTDVYVGNDAACRRFIEGMLWMTRSGAQWRLLPDATATGTASTNATTAWGAYQRHRHPAFHKIGRMHTQTIERKHLTLRTRIKRLARKTICFSKSKWLHDAVMGLFINRYEFGLDI